MLLWRLSGERYGDAFDGGYGLHFDGRWNTVGHAVTYCATSPALCVLEKLVHIEDPALLPRLVLVTYDAPGDLGADEVLLADLLPEWRRNETWTQQRGDEWHEAGSSPLLYVPSAIVPVAGSPDRNVLINHTHPGSAAITIRAIEPFGLDPRLF
jgi:RES domain-containing protein